ncbi:MAG: type II toxin-antitoxin system HicA family toxin [Acidobacteria bacterium]|nr:type II toxin-antitoxin system HicA family toxin [Solirubrobacteraceae bacterium]MBU6337936.1 type II toxin-antitoxin system HicA family toxin [Acidobacteriota bacterium]
MAWTFRDVERRLHREGWILRRQTGSHRVWKSPDGLRTVVVAGRPSGTVSRGMLAEIRRTSGIKEFR